jgi:hypothetical protein
MLRIAKEDYLEEEPGRRSAARLLTKDEARRIAANVAKVPGLVRKLQATRFSEYYLRMRPFDPQSRALSNIRLTVGSRTDEHLRCALSFPR